MLRSGQVTTLAFIRFPSFGQQVWAFGQMQFAHGGLRTVPGQTFYKLMGSGREGFSPWPDLSVYALLQVWENEGAAFAFFRSGAKWREYEAHSSEQWVLFLSNRSAKGSWDSREPFEIGPSDGANDAPYALVLTRATIRLCQLYRFWKYVPQSQLGLVEQPGLVYSKGVGEWPLTNMATVSIWTDEEGIRNFAYRGRGHREAIRRTREYDWYTEELFSRFALYAAAGTWDGYERRFDLPNPLG